MQLFLIHCENIHKVSLFPRQSLFSVSPSSICAAFSLRQNITPFKGEDKT